MVDFERILPEIINSLKSTSGSDFFNALTLQLHRHIGADYIMIARINTLTSTSKTVCLVAKGKLVENFEYSLKNTPCAKVNDNTICIYPQGICQLYPDDQLLVEMKIEGYIGTPLHDSHGNVIGLMVALHQEKIINPDFIVTLFELFSGRISAEFERSDRENELKVLANKLESKVLERTKVLSQTFENLKNTQQQLIQSEKMAALGNLTASIAHEINNPTNFTHAAVKMMPDEIQQIKNFLKQLAGGDNAEKQVLQSFDDKFSKLLKLSKTASEGANRLKIIVESLRTFSHLGHLEKQQVHISELVQSTVDLVVMEYKDIVITTNFDYDPLLSCFPSKLNQVFMNLIINGCQAIESKKQQRLTDKSGFKGKLTIESKQFHQQLQINLIDNGCGMNTISQEKLFQPFYTTKDANSGTGLGMSVSYDVIQAHHGTITVVSELGLGTTISILLPMTEPIT